MALRVTFGNGGSASTVSLVEGAEQFQTLSGPSVSSQGAGSGSVGQVVPGTEQAVNSVSVAGSGTGGKVDVGFTDNTFTFDVSTAWNSVKNAYVTNGGSTSGEKVAFTDFVQVDVDFSSATGSSSVEINDVKRANVTTGAGGDTIKLNLATNDAGWQNVINVNSAAGNDTITLGRGTVSDAAQVLDGSLTTVKIDAGAGNDTIDLSAVSVKSAIINGGTGNDTITLGGGAETVVIGANNGHDVINNFDAGKDTLDFGGASFVTVDLGSGSTLYKLAGGNSVIVNSIMVG